MKTIQGWDQFVADARVDPVLVPLGEGRSVTVHYPSKKKLEKIFDERANLRLYPEVDGQGEETNPGAIVILFGDEAGRRLIAECEDLDGVDRPLEHMACRVLVEFGLLKARVLDQFTRDADDDASSTEEGGDPNPSNSSPSPNGTEPSSNGISPSGSASISSISSAV